MLLILLCFLPAVILITVAIIGDIKRNRRYRGFYKTLPLRNFCRSENCVFSHRANEKDDSFIWFLNSNVFRLDERDNLGSTLFDPVKFYWKRRFKIWFKNNVNIDYLPEFRQCHSLPSDLKAEKDFPTSFAYDAYLRRYYAGVALHSIYNIEAPNEAIVRDVMEVTNKLVAELRFKERRGSKD